MVSLVKTTSKICSHSDSETVQLHEPDLMLDPHNVRFCIHSVSRVAARCLPCVYCSTFDMDVHGPLTHRYMRCPSEWITTSRDICTVLQVLCEVLFVMSSRVTAASVSLTSPLFLWTGLISCTLESVGLSFIA